MKIYQLHNPDLEYFKFIIKGIELFKKKKLIKTLEYWLNSLTWHDYRKYKEKLNILNNN